MTDSNKWVLPKTVEWVGNAETGFLKILDQRVLPNKIEFIETSNVNDVIEMIKTLGVRGAPAIGVAAAYGVFLAARSLEVDKVWKNGLDAEHAHERLVLATEPLKNSRPTAVNLAWAVDRMLKNSFWATMRKYLSCDYNTWLQNGLDEARAIHFQDINRCEEIGKNGNLLIPDRANILTHCNAGALATTGIGTALAPIYIAKSLGKQIKVYADETRPLLQGSRLTAWELMQFGIDTTILCDNMAASLMSSGKIDLVIVGADRISADGSVANKIGTLGVAILAKHYGIPFIVAAPTSTFDIKTPSGKDIVIEQRNPKEITHFCTDIQHTSLAPKDINVYNPAFDVTPYDLINYIVTEKGIIRKPDRMSILEHFKS